MQPLFFPLVFVAIGALVTSPAPGAAADTTTDAAPKTVELPLGEIAQQAARIAIRTAGLDETDASVDRLASRARIAALLPELRFGAKNSSGGMHDYVSSTGSVTSSYFGPSYELDASLVFHLDRLAYSGQEARLERLRLERIQARAHVTQRIVEEIARWAKAAADERDSPEGTETHADASSRRVAAEMALDVWTAGWFSARISGRPP